MLRLTRTESTDGVTVHLEGKLTGPWVGELRALIEQQGQALRSVDLSRVSYVDRAGAEYLAGLRGRGVEVRAATPFVAELLEQQA